MPKHIAYVVKSARVTFIEYSFILNSESIDHFYDIVRSSNDNDVWEKFSKDEKASVEFMIVHNCGSKTEKTVIEVQQKHDIV